MFSSGLLQMMAQQAAAEEFARKVAKEREGHIQGEGSPYSVGGYQSEIPNPGTADVPVQFSEPGVEQPFVDPIDVLTGGVGGGAVAVPRHIANRAAQDLADPFGRLASKYAPQALKKNPLGKEVDLLNNELKDMGKVPYEPKWNRQTELVPGYEKGAASIIDSDPYLRIEPDKNLMHLTPGKDTWVNNAFPYSSYGGKAARDIGREAKYGLSDGLYDSAMAGDMSWDTADSLMRLIWKGHK